LCLQRKGKRRYNKNMNSFKQCFKNYIEYFRDNPNQYWFKRKLYGWGWTPVKWQGWLVLFIWIIFFVFAMTTMEYDWLRNVIFMILSVGILIYICYKKELNKRFITETDTMQTLYIAIIGFCGSIWRIKDVYLEQVRHSVGKNQQCSIRIKPD